MSQAKLELNAYQRRVDNPDRPTSDKSKPLGLCLSSVEFTLATTLTKNENDEFSLQLAANSGRGLRLGLNPSRTIARTQNYKFTLVPQGSFTTPDSNVSSNGEEILDQYPLALSLFALRECSTKEPRGRRFAKSPAKSKIFWTKCRIYDRDFKRFD